AVGATLLNKIEVEDTMAATLRMANGSLATLSMTLGSRQEISRLRFCYENLVAESILEPYTMSRDPWVFTTNDATLQGKIDACLAEVPHTEDGYTRQFELFHEAITTGGDLPVTLADARRSLELVTAAYHSSRTGQPAQLPIGKDHPLYHSWLPQTPAQPG
ncbi:MAG TPA: Gfo/Idh/MocA family oxidoreductase, partial [Devosia sp.]|nr:Gfo/Idh/MocA family oxidoreductase [Devosia sp.]